MRISFFVLGSRGDVQPLVALAKGFADAGHDVRFVSDESARTLVTPYGIQGYFLGGNLQERIVSLSGRRIWRGRNPYRLARALTGAYADLISSWAVDAADAVQGSKLLITSNSSFGIGYAIAEKVRALPCEASVLPTASSRYLPSSLLPWPSLPLPGNVKRLLHEGARRAVWLGARDVVNAARRALKIEEVFWPFGPSRSGLYDAVPQLCAFSPTLIQRPPDWPKNVTITGSWHHRADLSWRPPQALTSFLEAGQPPVYAGFGSMPDSESSRVCDVVVRSIRRLGLRAIVAKGWGAMAGASSSSDILVVDDVPHEWLFPRVAAVVCHGGSGTVSAALRAGTPSVVVPYLADQPFWGWALERLGVAPRMVPRWSLSARKLTTALKQATADDAMRSRAKEVSRIVQTEEGVQRAMDVIEAWLSPTYASFAAGPRPLPAAVEKTL
jgi:sterol 3beta-glucosyltransferase